MTKISQTRKKQLRADVVEELTNLSIKEKVKKIIKKPVNKKIKRNWLKWFSFFGNQRWLVKVIILVGIVFLIIIVDIFGIYQFSWKDHLSWGVARVLNLPAGKVNNQNIKLSEYIKDIKILENALANEREAIASSEPNNNSIADRIFSRLVTNTLIENKLTIYDRQLDDDILDQYMTNVVGQIGDTQKAKEAISDLYDLSLEQFKTQVVRPLLMRQILQEEIIQDKNNTINLETIALAEKILKEVLKAETNFGEAADKYSEDTSATNNKGDLGWVSRGEFPQELESLLFLLPADTVHQQLVASDSGYHIFKVGERLVDPESGRESIRLSHILIKLDIDRCIKELIAGATVERYVY